MAVAQAPSEELLAPHSPPVLPENLGHFRILKRLGRGGMGEVFLAHDDRLDRMVAIKVLPQSLGADVDRLRRFEQEARAAGSLNHPNVLTVHDFGSHEGAPYLVTELLEGQTLRERLQGGPLPLRKALDHAIQIARGLARAVGGEPSAHGPTLLATEPGVVLGTSGYMSPEQVRGHPADARSDIFAFGAVLYELLTGQRAFGGDTHAERGYAILTREPPELTASGVSVPSPVERVVRRCLEKSPEERFQSARDLAFALEVQAEGSTPSDRSAGPAGVNVRRGWLTRPLVLALAAVAIGGLGVLAGSLRFAPVAAPEVRYTRVTYRNGVLERARFAEGGRSVVFSGALGTDPPQVFLATPGRPETRAVSPPWSSLEALSPQGDMLLKVAAEGDTLKWHLARAALAGGAPREVLDSFEAADLGPDGSLLVVRRVQGKARLDYPLGTTRLEMTGGITWPRVSPRGDHVAFLHRPVEADLRGTVELVDLRTGARRTLASRLSGVVEGLAWRPDGAEVWFAATRTGDAGGLHAVTLDGGERSVLAAPGHLVLNDVASDGRVLLRQTNLRQRTAALIRPAAREADLSWFDGTSVRDLTPDGRWLLFAEVWATTFQTDEYLVFVRRTDGAPAIALGSGQPLALSPDGSRALIAPRAPFDRLMLVPTGPGEATPLPPGDYTGAMEGCFFADGKRILFSSRAAKGGRRMWVQDLAGGAPRPLGPEGITDSTCPSPDGTRFVVVKDKAAFLVPLDGSPAQPLPRIRQGDSPVQWTADGKGLYLMRRPLARPRPEAVVVVHDIATGSERPWRVLVPPDPVGAVPDGVYLSGFPGNLVVTPDGTSYAYSYILQNSDFYVVEGLR
jgi:dipeptidyl aminopeptidase/acylaminoacyl peptidase